MNHICENEKWGMRGNTPKFLKAEKDYKRAYKNLLVNHYHYLINEERLYYGADERFNDEAFANWLRSEITIENYYIQFVEKGKALLTIIDEIIPKDTKLDFFVSVKNKLENIDPKQNVFSCVCYYKAMNNLCEFVHLHRFGKGYKIGLYLVKKADKHLGLGVLHYAAIASKLIRLANTDWTSKTADEVFKLIIRNFSRRYPISYPEMWYEHALPLAELAYQDYANGKQLQPVSIKLSDDYSINGRFHLPLSFHGYIAKCNRTNQVVVGFRGTDSFTNVITDITQYLVGTTLVYKMALGLLLEIRTHIKRQLFVVGHSLGGGLMQFAVAGLNDSKVEGVGFNSAGLSDMTNHLLHGKSGCIYHFHLKYDQVFLIGHQLGGCFDMSHEVYDPITAHRLSTMRKYSYFGSGLPYLKIRH